MRILRFLAFLALASIELSGVTGCHALEDLDECDDDQDCPTGQRCHSAEHFCEVDRGPVVVGALFPLSGSVGTFGRSMVDVAGFSQDFINQSGGVLGRTVAVEIVDDQSDEAVAELRMKELADRRAAGVVGLFRSAQALRAQAVAHSRQIVTITPAAGASSLALSEPETDRYLFQTITSIRRGSASAITYFASRFGPPEKRRCCTAVVMHTADITGVDYRDSLRELLDKQGASVSASIDFPVEAKPGYASEVEVLIDAHPDCAVLVAPPKIGANIIQEFNDRLERMSEPERASWQSFYWLGTSSLHAQAFLDEGIVGKVRPSEGVWGADVDSTPERLSYAKLQAAYNEHFTLPADTSLPPLAANTYDAFALMALSIHAGGLPGDGRRTRDAIWSVANAIPGDTSFDSTELTDAFLAISRGDPVEYNGASGPVELDRRGVVGGGTVIWNVTAGAFQTAHRFTEDETAIVETPSKTCP